MKKLHQQAIRRPRSAPQPHKKSVGNWHLSGAVALEFAIVLPMMLLVLIGILEFGRMGALGIRLAQAARAGAEYGALHPPDDFTLSDWARMCELRAREVLADQPGIDLSRLEVQSTFTSASPLSRSEVRIRHPFSLLLGWNFAPGNLVLQKTAVIPVVR
jgi:hypothetical protein